MEGICSLKKRKIKGGDFIEEELSSNLMMPVNPRYQQRSMIPYFGYDNYAGYLINVEWALLEALADIGVMPEEDAVFLTPELKQKLKAEITTTIMDIREEVTRHDIRALVQLMQEDMPSQLGKWVHFGATSYDIISNANVLAMRDACTEVTLPTLFDFMEELACKAEEYANQVQIGRTHGQHALPITVGFWLATLLNRFWNSAENLMFARDDLVGKFSGAVGVANAQEAFLFEKKSQEKSSLSFEELTLSKLELAPSLTSTQIVMPNPMARFLFEYLLLSSNFKQLGDDWRHLQRSEIAEIAEIFVKGQVGSSTMAHKRNPITAEHISGLYEIIQGHFLVVTNSLCSEHQRDLRNSPIMRDYPAIIILAQRQIEKATGLISKMIVDVENLQRNLNMNKDSCMAELWYLALQMYGYEGDSHEFVNHTVMPRIKENDSFMNQEIWEIAKQNEELSEVLGRIPVELQQILEDPEKYTGLAEQKTLKTVKRVKESIKGWREIVC